MNMSHIFRLRINPKVLCLLLMSFFLIHQAEAQSPSLKDRISITVSTDKQNFQEHEPIYVEIIVKNLKSNDIEIPSPGYVKQLRLIIQDENKNIIPENRFWGGSSDTTLLASNDQIAELTSLAFFYNDNDNTPDPLQSHLKIGAYTICARLGDVLSDTLSIRIEPLSQSEIEVLQSIKDIKKTGLTDNSIAETKGLIQKYQQSIFLHELYDLLLVKMSLSSTYDNKTDEMIDYSLQYLDRYQNTSFANQAITKYLNALRRKIAKEGVTNTVVQSEKIQDEMTKLQKKYSSERISRYINRLVLQEKEMIKSNH